MSDTLISVTVGIGRIGSGCHGKLEIEAYPVTIGGKSLFRRFGVIKESPPVATGIIAKDVPTTLIAQFPSSRAS